MANVTLNKTKLIHNEFYPEYIKLAKRFTEKPSGGREAIKYANHKADGTLEATDSYKALIVENAHGYEKDLLINPRNMQAIEGLTYPDMNKILPEIKNAKCVIHVTSNQIRMWKQCVVSINSMTKTLFKSNFHLVTLRAKQDEMKIEVTIDDDSVITHLPFREIEGALPEISFSPEVLRDCLEVASIGFGIAEIYLFESNRAMKIKKDNLTVLCMPARKSY